MSGIRVFASGGFKFSLQNQRKTEHRKESGLHSLNGQGAGEGTGHRDTRRDETVQAKTWQKESCELPCLGQALPGEGWLFPGKTLRLKDGSLEMPLLSQEPKGSSQVEQDTMCLCCYWMRLLKVAWEPAPPPPIRSSSLPPVVSYFPQYQVFLELAVTHQGTGSVSTWFSPTP